MYKRYKNKMDTKYSRFTVQYSSCISLFPAHQSQKKYFRKTFRQIYLQPHQLRNEWIKTVTFAAEQTWNFYRRKLENSPCQLFTNYTTREYGGQRPRKKLYRFLVLNLEAIVWKKKEKNEKGICLTGTDAFYKIECQVLGCSIIQSLCSFLAASGASRN